VEALRTRPDFVMVFVDAPQRVRHERSLARGRGGDPVSFADFAAEEARQMQPQGGDPSAQALAACRELADVILVNEGTVEEFTQKVVEFTARALFDYFLPRPNWDEYFMMMAEVAATRGNCIKRRVGAVIVLDRQILATGYNGTPKGIKNCYEGGCPRGRAWPTPAARWPIAWGSTPKRTPSSKRRRTAWPSAARRFIARFVLVPIAPNPLLTPGSRRWSIATVTRWMK
jgi:dCMP deaminase